MFSYLENLSPEMILVIAATTPFLQVPAVRDAVCKHVSFRPSIQVDIPVRQRSFSTIIIYTIAYRWS